jgi:ankyrin repeat protein
MRTLFTATLALGLILAASAAAGPLLDSVNARDFPAVERRLAAGEDVNEEDADGCTALCHAVRERDVEIAKLLLKKGANPNIRDASGRSPMSTAAHFGDLEIIPALADHDAFLEYHDAGGGTPLFAAVRADKVEAAELLLDLGADPNARDLRNRSALYWSRSSAMTGLLRENGGV